jgi:uncharacterized membrane protein
MFNDFFIIVFWWLLLFVLGVINLPLAWWLFRKFFDLGYIFAKILAILLVSYFVWLISSLRILPFSTISIWLTLIALALINLLIARKFKKELVKDIRGTIKILLFEEVLFFTCLAFWAFIRGYQPDINGLEKFMDFGFMNSILRSDYFPPADMWMSGKTINYYYFGHLVAAVLTKLSGLKSAITYNLMLATIFGLSFVAGFSLSANFLHRFLLSKKRKIRWQIIFIAGILSALLLTLGGNLHTAAWHLIPAIKGDSQFYWYPDATRFIGYNPPTEDKTIHEFPIYSFVVSDLHGHVSDIPFVLLLLGLLFSFLISKNQTPYAIAKRQAPLIRYTPLLALVLAAMYMTNSWDLPIYLLITGLVLLYFNYLPPKVDPPLAEKSKWKIETFINTAIYSLAILFLAIIFGLPFHLNFRQIAQGVALVNAHSFWWQLLVLWGYQWMLCFSLMAFLGLKKWRSKKYQPQTSDIFVFILLVIAFTLIVLPEIIYVKDIYIPSYHRANTMFKLVYQSFVMYALVSGYIIARVLINVKKRIIKLLLVTCYLLLVTSVLSYPYFAIRGYYGTLKNYRGLDGLTFLEQKYPEDFQTLEWIEENIQGQPVLLEAVGDSYTEFNRLSMASGLPTVEGWLVHEWLWRGSFDEPGKRAGEVQKIYESPSPDEVKLLISKYGVEYIYIGGMERQKYQVAEEKFEALGEIVFQEGNSKLYKIN